MQTRENKRIEKFDIRALGDGQSIVGYAAVFNQPAHGEMVAPGAFTKTLQLQEDIRAYWSHDAERSQVLARLKNGTLALSEDEIGLRVLMRPNLDTTWGRDALAAVERSDVDKMSFGFSPVEAVDEIHAGETVRVLKEVRLYEVSLVSEPWYDGTTASVRNADDSGSGHSRAGCSSGLVATLDRELQLLEMLQNG